MSKIDFEIKDDIFYITLENGDKIKGDRLLINILDNKEKIIEGVMLGDWDIKDLISNKIYLKEVLGENILNKTPKEEKEFLKEIRKDLKKIKSDYALKLDGKKEEIFYKYFTPTPKLKLEGEGKIDFTESDFKDKEEVIDFLNENLDDFQEITDNDRNNKEKKRGELIDNIDFKNKK